MEEGERGMDGRGEDARHPQDVSVPVGDQVIRPLGARIGVGAEGGEIGDRSGQQGEIQLGHRVQALVQSHQLRLL